MSDEIIEPAAPALPPDSARVQTHAGVRPSREDGRPAAPTRVEERRDPEEAGSVGLPAGRDGDIAVVDSSKRTHQEAIDVQRQRLEPAQ